MFEDNFLRLTVIVRFQIMGTSKMSILLSFFSVSYSNVAFTKQIYFSPTFLKLWVHISDSIARVVGGAQYF